MTERKENIISITNISQVRGCVCLPQQHNNTKFQNRTDTVKFTAVLDQSKPFCVGGQSLPLEEQNACSVLADCSQNEG